MIIDIRCNWPPTAWVALTGYRAFLHDPAVHPEPDASKPQRFRVLDKDSEGNLRDDSSTQLKPQGSQQHLGTADAWSTYR